MIKRWMDRIRRTTPSHARLFAEPGQTLDLVDREGRVVAKVILSTITHDRSGTSVEFVDYFQTMARWRR